MNKEINYKIEIQIGNFSSLKLMYEIAFVQSKTRHKGKKTTVALDEGQITITEFILEDLITYFIFNLNLMKFIKVYITFISLMEICFLLGTTKHLGSIPERAAPLLTYNRTYL